MKRKIVCMCGSMRFRPDFERAVLKESKKGNIVLSVSGFAHEDLLKLTPEEKEVFDALHLDKVRMADEVLVIDKDGYIGQSTAREIMYARSIGKSVSFFFGLAQDNTEDRSFGTPPLLPAAGIGTEGQDYWMRIWRKFNVEGVLGTGGTTWTSWGSFIAWVNKNGLPV
ncbi:MAG: hypothetical protein JW765_04585 [Deltaproteobacteria bacterium]|nr:hypothetical protein [Candidatus Zymogenaceae bacterium]